jgi:hypothetical protein
MSRLLPAMLLCAVFLVQTVAVQKASDGRNKLPSDANAAYSIPSQLVKLSAPGFDGIAADFFFIKALAHIGGAKERAGKGSIGQEEWRWFEALIRTVIELDPYFLDPYTVATAYLPWDAGMTKEANALLEKGSNARDWDPILPFYAGFNHFYFLHDNEQASEWLMKAARKPGASPVYAIMATKLAYEGGKRTENSILFLEEMVRHSEDEELRKHFKMRILALTNMLILEKAVDGYKRQTGQAPANLETLLHKGFIKQIPEDPYGGNFYLDPEGKVRTTSKLSQMTER